MAKLLVLLALLENSQCQATIQAVMIVQQESSVRGKPQLVCNVHSVISLKEKLVLVQNACPVHFLPVKAALLVQNAARENFRRVMGLKYAKTAGQELIQQKLHLSVMCALQVMKRDKA